MDKQSKVPRRLRKTKMNLTPEATKGQFEASEMVERFLAVIELGVKVASRTQSKPVSVSEAARDQRA